MSTNNLFSLGKMKMKMPIPAPEAGAASQQNPKAQEKFSVGVPLARIVPRELKLTPELALVNEPRSAAAEHFRRLKTLLLHRDEGAPQVILVTSATPSEGKSLVAMNLALAFAADLRGETLLVDADIRRPRFDDFLEPKPGLGLTDILSGQIVLEHAILHIAKYQLHILPAGKSAADPVQLLSSDYMGVLMTTLRQRFQRIIIDTPPIVPFTDADVLGKHSDGVLMVARVEKTPMAALRQALGSISSTRILGIVLNDVVFNLADRSRYYGNYYEHYYEKGSK